MGAVSRSTCKWCQAPIIWALTPEGQRIPLDVKMRLVARYIGDTEVVEFIRGRESHFATCPEADKHRKDEQVSLFDVMQEFEEATSCPSGGVK